MKTRIDDTVVVRDRSSRRRFIRTGTAFILAGSAIATTASGQGRDCDSGQGGAQRTNCSDEDTGENQDPRGCAPCGELVPSSMRRHSGDKSSGVAKIKA